MPLGSASLPEGFIYRPEFISVEEEQSLIREIARLPLSEFSITFRILKPAWRAKLQP